MLRSSSDWLLWNIHFQYGNGSFLLYVDCCLSSLTDKTFVFPLSLTRLLSFLSHWQDFCLSSLTDKTFVVPLSLTRLLSFLSHWQDFCLSSLTDKTFVVPLSLTRFLSFLSHWQDLCRTWLWYHGVCRIRNRNSLHFYDEVRLARLFSFLCCVFCFACLSSVNCVQCCMWIWIFHFLLSVNSLLSSPTFIVFRIFILN
jgi:hypothetical protein